MKKKNTNIMNFKTVADLAYFTAETVIHKEFKSHKAFPKDWDYVLTENEVKYIPQKHIKDEVMNDLESFNGLVVQMIDRKLQWFLAEGFTVEEDTKYRFLSDEEISDELNKISVE